MYTYSCITLTVGLMYNTCQHTICIMVDLYSWCTVHVCTCMYICTLQYMYTWFILLFSPQGVDPIITTSFHSALHSLGGIQAFFPFFSQLDSPQITADKEETAIDHTLRYTRSQWEGILNTCLYSVGRYCTINLPTTVKCQGSIQWGGRQGEASSQNFKLPSCVLL